MKQQLYQSARNVLVTAIASLCASSALAQLTFGEVVFTAQQREVNLSGTAIAITALTSDRLSDLGIVSQ